MTAGVRAEGVALIRCFACDAKHLALQRRSNNHRTVLALTQASGAALNGSEVA